MSRHFAPPVPILRIILVMSLVVIVWQAIKIARELPPPALSDRDKIRDLEHQVLGGPPRFCDFGSESRNSRIGGRNTSSAFTLMGKWYAPSSHFGFC